MQCILMQTSRGFEYDVKCFTFILTKSVTKKIVRRHISVNYQNKEDNEFLESFNINIMSTVSRFR